MDQNQLDDVKQTSETLLMATETVLFDENVLKNMAKIMARYKKELIEAGFSSVEAQNIVENSKPT